MVNVFKIQTIVVEKLIPEYIATKWSGGENFRSRKKMGQNMETDVKHNRKFLYFINMRDLYCSSPAVIKNLKLKHFIDSNG